MIAPRQLVPIAAGAGIVLGLHRLYELAVALPELDLATPGGRVRLVAFMLSRTPGPLVADVLLIGSVLIARDHRWIRLLGWLHGVAGVGLLILVLPVFLDASGRIAASVGLSELTPFRLLVARGLVVILGGAAGALLAARLLLGLARASESHSVEARP